MTFLPSRSNSTSMNVSISPACAPIDLVIVRPYSFTALITAKSAEVARRSCSWAPFETAGRNQSGLLPRWLGQVRLGLLALFIRRPSISGNLAGRWWGRAEFDGIEAAPPAARLREWKSECQRAQAPRKSARHIAH